MEWLKNNWPIVAFAVGILINVSASYTLNQVTLANIESRVSTVEDRQDRQGVTMQAMQLQVTSLSNDIAGMKSTINSISSNVDYIRNRIDRITQ